MICRRDQAGGMVSKACVEGPKCRVAVAGGRRLLGGRFRVRPYLYAGW